MTRFAVQLYISMCRELGTLRGVINERTELEQLKIISSRNYDEGSANLNGSINEIENCLIAARKMFTFISNLRTIDTCALRN